MVGCPFHLTRSPLGFVTEVNGLPRVRFGVQNTGFAEIERLEYVLEFGARTW